MCANRKINEKSSLEIAIENGRVLPIYLMNKGLQNKKNLLYFT